MASSSDGTRSGLRGPSAEALAAAERELAAGLAGVEQERVARVGEDLFALAAVVSSDPRLRRTLTDASLDPSARSGLVRTVFGRKVDAVSLSVCATAVGNRWTSPGDLAVGLERLGVETTVRGAGDPDRLADELFGVGRLVTQAPELRNALGDPARSTVDKQRLLEDLLGGRVLPATAALLGQAVSGTHRTPGLALEDYSRIASAVQGERVATVRSARPLAAPERERLQAALSAQYDRAVHLNVVVEPALLGGLRVEIGDDVIDGSVASRLDEARRRLAG
ncbi:MAG: ATP synthase delta chain [uncultured Nocardioidaceae bacterium]|uniref:ATP synthase subunit delta n=1 Tax=uncultured Nocardioidaceae bacterium TaxID=253824 RepID=A0A6J4L8T3_9ACTN|nr:MAG: ATP synthase delta chain [uncultured Nocardioidaceae bacterium]